MPALRVFMAATSYPRDASDWQGRFIYDQAASVARRGVSLALWSPPGELPPNVASALTPDDGRWLEALLKRGGIAHLLRHRPPLGLWCAWQLLRRLRAACKRTPADVYHVNWLQNALALPDDGRPALVTVLGSDYRLLGLPGMTTVLRRHFARRQVMLAPNAAWMAPHLEALFGEVATVRPIPFGVDEAWFGLERRTRADRSWLVVSRITRAKVGALFDWGEDCFPGKRKLRLLGPMQESIALPNWIEYAGPTAPAALQASGFPEAAGLLTLSRHAEGRPQVLIEAMAAGLPVIASRMPAHEDLVRHRETGWLVSSAKELEQALAEAENAAIAYRVGAAARQFVRRHIGTWDDCARRYLEAYGTLSSGAGR